MNIEKLALRKMVLLRMLERNILSTPEEVVGKVGVDGVVVDAEGGGGGGGGEESLAIFEIV
jgi:hypothetical protein